MASKAFEWYISNPEELKKYTGRHVAIIDDQVIAVGDSAKEAYEIAKRKFPKEIPLLTYIPKGETLVL